MDRGSCLFSLCVLIYCIFQTARFSNGDECPCPEIPQVNLTKTPPTHCFKIGEKFRYECKAGYVREAGTSSLIRCIQTSKAGEWTQRHLKCKRDPKRSTREPTTPPLIKETTNIYMTSTDPMTSDSLLAEKPNFVTEATNEPAPPPIAGNHTADFASEPKYIVSSCIALVCVVALVGGIIYIFYKRRTATAAQPLPAEQVPMANDPF